MLDFDQKEFSSRDFPQVDLKAALALDSEPNTGKGLLVTHLVEDSRTRSTFSSQQDRLLAIAQKANLKHFLTIDIPDAMVRSSLASGQDPCTTAQDFIDNTIL